MWKGLISLGYQRDKYGPYARLYQHVKLYLFNPSSAIYSCPLAMTDGAARLIELFGDESDKQEYLPHLLSRDPQQFWTSGQWMTERAGGSDVANTETIAKKSSDGRYELYGYKYFTSSVTSEMALLLARIDDPQNFKLGSKGLSTFIIKTRKQDGSLNNIIVHRLKDKLGTKALPTAELELTGSEAKLVGNANRGVAIISTILNTTRVHNAVASISAMRRGIAIVRDYSSRRKVFGKFLCDQPLHVTTLSRLEVTFRGCLYFLLDVLGILGKLEVQVEKSNFQDEFMLRILTPLLKLYLGKESVAVMSECLEALGGLGYMEDTDLPRLFRDVQVTSIWEGTTNVLSLDVWRPILGTPGNFSTFISRIFKNMEGAHGKLEQVRKVVEISVERIQKHVESVKAEIPENSARDFAYSLARTYIASLMVCHAVWSKQEKDVNMALRWVHDKPMEFSGEIRPGDREIAMDVDASGRMRGVGDGTSTQVRSLY
eukprot:TRINITY_DN4863_c0_g1_i2.p1 TRINITY_DN4863_c0_g1~~TRINITY_DN4863_c0_g1_i2.p1  ORF type:complete len:487 (+),score=136.83 TRINITY_DN4863_c0_g1_i2:336-1796(+)